MMIRNDVFALQSGLVDRWQRHELTRIIRQRLQRRLHFMSSDLDRSCDQPPFDEILHQADGYLDQIAELLLSEEIHPQCGLRLCEHDPECHPTNGRIKLGFYPIAGNPLHLGHLLGALSAIAEHSLDQVVFVIQGIDSRKLNSSITTQIFRHDLALAPYDVLQYVRNHPEYAALIGLTHFNNSFQCRAVRS